MATEPNETEQEQSLQALVAALEPTVIAASLGTGPLDDAIMSAAVSLKRIADATEKLAQPIAEQIVAGLRAPINSYGEGIGEAIQGQIVRGQRGIDQYEGRD